MNESPVTEAANMILVEQIRQLTKERDEARREVLNAMHPDLRNGYAAAREWRCFEEETP
jgi:hypothetical protein